MLLCLQSHLLPSCSKKILDVLMTLNGMQQCVCEQEKPVIAGIPAQQFIITGAMGGYILLLFVRLSVKQRNSASYRLIWMKSLGEVGNGPRNNHFYFGDHVDSFWI